MSLPSITATSQQMLFVSHSAAVRELQKPSPAPVLFAASSKLLPQKYLQQVSVAEPARKFIHPRSSSAVERQYHTMDASKALTQSMHHMTATELAALTQQQQRYEKNKSSILEAIGRENKAYGKVKALLDGYTLHKIAVTSNISLANVRRFLDQSQHDQSVSSNLLQNWRIALEQALDIPSRKYEHALLFGRLVTEWLGTDKGSQASATAEDMDTFEPVG